MLLVPPLLLLSSRLVILPGRPWVFFKCPVISPGALSDWFHAVPGCGVNWKRLSWGEEYMLVPPIPAKLQPPSRAAVRVDEVVFDAGRKHISYETKHTLERSRSLSTREEAGHCRAARVYIRLKHKTLHG